MSSTENVSQFSRSKLMLGTKCHKFVLNCWKSQKKLTIFPQKIKFQTNLSTKFGYFFFSDATSFKINWIARQSFPFCGKKKLLWAFFFHVVKKFVSLFMFYDLMFQEFCKRLWLIANLSVLMLEFQLISFFQLEKIIIFLLILSFLFFWK